MVSSITDMINNIAVYMQYLFYAITASVPRKEEVAMRRQVLRYKSVTLKYIGHENADYITFSAFAQYNFWFWLNFTYIEKKHFIYQS